jgi:hypothetical protein
VRSESRAEGGREIVAAGLDEDHLERGKRRINRATASRLIDASSRCGVRAAAGLDADDALGPSASLRTRNYASSSV